MEESEEFKQAADRLLERLEWSEIAAQKDGRDLSVQRAAKAELDEFIARFRDHAGSPKIGHALEQLEAVSAAAGRHLESARLIDLFSLVVARAHWWQAELHLPLRITVNRIMAAAPPEFRAAVLAEWARADGSADYDPVAAYRASEAACDETEKEFRRALARFENEWPGSLDAAARQRLLQLDLADLDRWTNEIKAALAEVERAPDGT